MAIDILGLSPALIALIVVGIFVFLKVMKYALLIAVVAGIYLAAKFGLVPGVAPF